jgi:hypothetical protein
MSKHTKITTTYSIERNWDYQPPKHAYGFGAAIVLVGILMGLCLLHPKLTPADIVPICACAGIAIFGGSGLIAMIWKDRRSYKKHRAEKGE